ncbi:MAG: TonB-dependent receptor [Mediterranea sp.]|jgi:TonB-linked SusC/RagA family outer membrane protein|nr:TonB-dependent receptor [Mediterranea sp.]
MNLTARKTPLMIGLCLSLLVNGISVHATVPEATEITQQSRRISGTVIDQNGEPVIGANVREKGTTNGVITNIDGEFAINVPTGATLEVSYIGFITESVRVASGSIIQVVLREDSQSLEEVVVIGYGVQKKKLVTGATVQVSGDNIQKMSSQNAFSALQGQTPGVNITQSSGMPGEGFKVNIRGLGTNGNSSPLYVVDGISHGNSGDVLNNLNPNDIESVDVLKDAASAAIYGSQAANGVILITTKQGKAGKITLSYDGYYGVQNIQRRPASLTAAQYILINNERDFNDGTTTPWQNIPQYIYNAALNDTWKGTDWIKEMSNENAPIQNHSLNLSGGSEISRFTLSFAYNDQEGILGKPVALHANRYTFRINSDHVLYKVKNMDVIKIGENLTYTKRDRTGIAGGNRYWNDVHDAMAMTPLLPMWDTFGEAANLGVNTGEYYLGDAMIRDGWTFEQSKVYNPIAQMQYSSRGQNLSQNFNLYTNVYAEVQPIKGLKWRSVFNYSQNAWNYKSYNQPVYLNPNSDRSAVDNVSQQGGMGYSWGWENTLNYVFRVNDLHNIDVLVGHNMGRWGYSMSLNASDSNTYFPGLWDYAMVNNSPHNTTAGTGSYGGSIGNLGVRESVFGRAIYNYDEKYLFTAIMRADGSSNFAKGKRWGYFPSVSAGWVITNEPFMADLASKGLDFFKLRASWGQNGNDNTGSFQWLTRVATTSDFQYYFGNKNTATDGAVADRLSNPDLTWETSEQLNIGFDARFLNQRLGVNFDYYVKTTRDWITTPPTLASYGAGAPSANGGDVENRGVEIAVTWNDRINKDFSYGISVNASHNKNKVTRMNSANPFVNGEANIFGQGTDFISRYEVGFPMGFFYGYKTQGIFQNAADVQKYPYLQGVVAQPGDVIFVDINNDGTITDADKTMMGNPNPSWMGGINLNFQYKGFDFMLSGVGAFGFQLARSYRSYMDNTYENYTADILERWHGEGTSNKLPRMTSGNNPNWARMSDIWLWDGDYFRIQNVTVGYDFKKLLPQLPFGKVRLYATVQNLYTFTSYPGMDPEIGYADQDWARGIDLGFYPSPRTVLVGVNLSF